MPAVYLGQVFDAIKLVLNKERKGSVKDSQIVTSLRVGSLNYFGRQLMEYRAGAEVPSTLRQQKITAPLATPAGIGVLPADFAKEVSFVTADPLAKHGEFLSAPEFIDRTTSQLLPPTAIDPIGKVGDNSILVYPIATANIFLTYIRKPVEFVLAVTVDADGRGSTVNLATSTDIDFPPECLPDIIKEALVWLGIKQQDGEVIQLGATVKE